MSCYHVFLSFRGEDIRHGFIRHLHGALQAEGIRTFIDDKGFERGEELSRRSLLDAIERTRTSLVVFSENYASSTWLLDELVKIMECVQVRGQSILPVFYDVDPSDVRRLRGRYGQALSKHLQKSEYCRVNLPGWTKALEEAANISGLCFNPRRESESELIGKIVESILRKACRVPLRVANYPVGLGPQLLELRSLLDVGSACGVKVVGVYGMGGIGKTTLAKALYNGIADQFECSSFMHDIRENSTKCGLVRLQERLLSDLLGYKAIEFKLDNVDTGISTLQRRLSGKRVLLVLDDISCKQHLEALAGGCSWYGNGSRIIITTRDRRLLDSHRVRTQFEVSPLNAEEALELFSWNAFRANVADPSYLDASRRALLCAKGLPLALKAMGGSCLYGKSACQWDSMIAGLEGNCDSAATHDALSLSCTSLDQDLETIFFEGHRVEYASNLLRPTCGLNFDLPLKGLVDKHVRIHKHGFLCMHDLMQDLCGQIVMQQSQPEHLKALGSTYKDVFCGLKDNTGTDNIDFISSKHFKNLCLPRFLNMTGCPSSFASNINPGKVGTLDLISIPYKPLKAHMQFKCLSHMVFNSCELIRELPDLSGAVNLSELHLEDCRNLTTIHHSVIFLPHLRSLHLQGCVEIETSPHAMKLKRLDLSGCKSLQTYPEISLPKMNNVRKGNLLRIVVQKLLKACTDFKSFSMSKGQQGSPTLLSSVTHLDLSECNLSDQVLVYIVCFPNLQNLNLGSNNFTILPSCIKECSNLSYLSLDDCKNLHKIEGIPPNIELFRATNCTSLAPISVTMLLSQALHEAGNTQFILPGSRIPEWFDHLTWGGSVSFWVRKKFPHIALCFVLRSSDSQLRMCKFRMFINGKYLFDFDCNLFLTLAMDHIMLFDLRSQMANNEVDEMLLDNEWNLVQVLCVDAPSLEGSIEENVNVGCIGVYVYKQLSSVKDIRFANPNSGKRKDDLFCFSGDLEQHCNPLLKRRRKFLDMGAFQTPNMHQQNNLGSVTQNNLIRFQTEFEDRGKYSAGYSGAGMKSDIEWLALLPSLQPLAGAKMMLDPVVSENMSDLSYEKASRQCLLSSCGLADVKLMNKSCQFCGSIHLGKSKQTSVNPNKPVADVCDQSRQTQLEKIHAEVPENSDNLGSLTEEANINLISMEHSMDRVDSGLNDIGLKEIYASIESEATDLASIIDTETNIESVCTKLSDEAMKALQILRYYVTKRFSFLLDPGRSRFLKIILEYLLSLSENDGISLRMRSVILQLSRSFSLWSRDYNAASVRLELATANLVKVDKLQVDIETNVKKVEDVDALMDGLGSKLASLQERKRQLEEHIRSITEEIMELR